MVNLLASKSKEDQNTNIKTSNMVGQYAYHKTSYLGKQDYNNWSIIKNNINAAII